MMAVLDQVTYGSSTIAYAIERRSRKTLAIEVHPNGHVLVKAPQAATIEAIRQRVGKRGGWILKQQRAFAQYPPPLAAREYVSGETYRYLGRQCRLKVIPSESERVRLWRGRLEVEARDLDDSRRVQRLVTAWLRERARIVFGDRYEYCTRLARQHGIEHDAGFELLRMPKRWGSCTKEGRLLLNPALVSAPKGCIDYVIIHELCHTVEHNHGPEFYILLARLMPDWKEIRRALNGTTEVLDL